jgi:hypothetical protein
LGVAKVGYHALGDDFSGAIWGLLGYKLATSQAGNMLELPSISFGWGAVQIDIPFSTNHVGLMMLATIGAIPTLKAISDSLSGNRDMPEHPRPEDIPTEIWDLAFNKVYMRGFRGFIGSPQFITALKNELYNLGYWWNPAENTGGPFGSGRVR